jgi:methylated-DNA-[protein]-cysteine S-methyltransferase
VRATQGGLGETICQETCPVSGGLSTQRVPPMFPSCYQYLMETKMPATRFYHLFETDLGWMGIAWNDVGVTVVQTPDRDSEATERRMLRRAGTGAAAATSELPAPIADAVNRLSRYASGEIVDFSAIPLDIEAEPFFQDIWRAARDLGFGETVTYGELASRAGHPGLYRETGQALGANPVPIIVPCHRIVAAGGKLGGFSAPGGPKTKERLLALEGVHVGPPPAAQSAFQF